MWNVSDRITRKAVLTVIKTVSGRAYIGFRVERTVVTSKMRRGSPNQDWGIWVKIFGLFGNGTTAFGENYEGAGCVRMKQGKLAERGKIRQIPNDLHRRVTKTPLSKCQQLAGRLPRTKSKKRQRRRGEAMGLQIRARKERRSRNIYLYV